LRNGKTKELNGSTLPSPLIETAWLDGHLTKPNLRILDCSVAMKAADDGGHL
jgi:hypothetical protein